MVLMKDKELPQKDLREVYKPAYTVDVPDVIKPSERHHDMRFILSVGGEIDPWRFDEVSTTQKVKCRLGFHRGRVEVIGGEICFYCSYCGNITR